MVKRTMNLYVDSELVELAKRNGFNLSQLFHQALKTVVGSSIPEKDDERAKKKQDLEDEVLKLKAMIAQKKQVLDEFKAEEKKEFTKKYGKIIKTITPRSSQG